jgi:hypothetical protein
MVKLPKALLSLGTGEGVAERSPPKDAERCKTLGFGGLSRKSLGLGTLQRPITLITATSP